MVTVELTLGQGDPGTESVVRVSTTVPLVMFGVYVELSALGLLNVPLEALQVALVAEPPIVPARVIGLFEHAVCAGPAFAVGLVSTVMNTLANT